MRTCLTALLATLACAAASATQPALEQCRQRVMDYAWFWDHADTEGFAALFTEDAELTLSGETFSGRDAIVERMAAARGGPVMRHAMTTVRVTATDATTASGVSYLTLYVAEPVTDGLPSVDGFALIGEYHDTFRLSGDDCRIAARRLIPILRRSPP